LLTRKKMRDVFSMYVLLCVYACACVSLPLVLFLLMVAVPAEP
jgi:hypothetical protein